MKKNRKRWAGLCYALKKPLRTMRWSLFFFLLSIFQANAISGYAQKTQLSLDFRGASIENILNEIENQSDFYFLYNKNLIDVKRKTDIRVKNQQVSVILDQLFIDSNVRYRIFDRQIVLSNDESQQNEFSSQIKTISGKVSDSAGAPLPGVTVVVKGTTQGTITNGDGNYSLPGVPGDGILVFSFVGMKTQEILLGGKTSINVIMTEDAIGIEEVVAIGYGTQKKITVTGSIVSTKGEDLVKSPSQNLANSLTGRLPGVVINTRSGEPGYDDPTIYIRGKSTTGNANPLVIIDGVERDGLSRLNPNDIENVTVLKDASAAIYGARAANGVIIVTTKRGTTGKPQFEVSLNQGFSHPTRKLKMADSYTFASVLNESRITKGLPLQYTNEELQKFKDGSDPDNYPNTNWQKLMVRDLSPTERVNISATGGNEKIKYLVSLGGLDQAGQYNYGYGKYQQVNFRSNIDIQVTDYLKFGFDLSGQMEHKRRPYDDAATISSNVMKYPPTWIPFWAGTDYIYPNLYNGRNVFNIVSDNSGYTENKYKSLTSTLSFKLDIPWISSLWIDGSANYDTGYNFYKKFYKPAYVYEYDEESGIYSKLYTGTATSSLAEYFNQNSYLTVNAKINFKKSFKNHNIEAMVGYEQRQTDYDYLYASRSNYTTSVLDELFAGSSNKNDQSNNGTSSKTARQNVFGRISYDYAGKYMAQALFRYDGSQNFAKENRFGFFPGFSFGWRASEEPFLKNLGFVNNLKIRASYGEMGNDQVSSYQYLSSYTYSNQYSYVIGDTDISGLAQNNVPNPDITWEVAKTSNLGLEATLWNNLLGVELDVFKTRRSNILTTSSAVVPGYTGLSLPDENVGIVENKGFELQLSHSNQQHLLKYNISGNFSFARNKVIFAEEAAGVEDYQLAIGHPMNTSLYYKAIGIYRDEAQVDNTPHMVGAKPGDIIYFDANDDGEITTLDMIRIDKTNVPEIIYGFSLSFAYKNFDLSALIQGQANANFYDKWLGRMIPNDGFNFFSARAKNYWTEENIDASMPRNEYGGGSHNLETSTMWLKDAGFLRLKNLELGYNIPRSFTERIKVEGLRIYANGFNLFYIYDNLKKWGVDPEANNSIWYYSQQRVFNIGLKLNF